MTFFQLTCQLTRCQKQTKIRNALKSKKRICGRISVQFPYFQHLEKPFNISFILSRIFIDMPLNSLHEHFKWILRNRLNKIDINSLNVPQNTNGVSSKTLTHHMTGLSLRCTLTVITFAEGCPRGRYFRARLYQETSRECAFWLFCAVLRHCELVLTSSPN